MIRLVEYIINYSLKNQVPVAIIYQKGLEISQRKIQVIRINEVSVLAFCYYKKAIRSFKKEYILSAHLPDVQWAFNYEATREHNSPYGNSN